MFPVTPGSQFFLFCISLLENITKLSINHGLWQFNFIKKYIWNFLIKFERICSRKQIHLFFYNKFFSNNFSRSFPTKIANFCLFSLNPGILWKTYPINPMSGMWDMEGGRGRGWVGVLCVKYPLSYWKTQPSINPIFFKRISTQCNENTLIPFAKFW